ncbi:MAG: hypothetical protein L0Z55_00695 [Planctomycetes bacterium]|nr:hypothetical protein [Planctomycetota bacterium]
MHPARPVYVVGGAHTPFIGKFHPDFIWKGHPAFGKRENPTLEQHLHRAVREALENSGVAPAQVDRGIVSNFVGELFVGQGHLGAMLAGAHPDLAYKPFHRVEGACASGALALVSGIEAIAAGANLVLVAGVEVQTTVGAKQGADFLARAAHYAREREIDPFTFPCLFARRAKAYFERHGGTTADLAPIVLKAYTNAARNPYAHMRAAAMDLATAAAPSERNPNFLENPDYKEFLKVSDCSQVSDGASSVVLASPDGLEQVGVSANEAVEIVAFGHATGPLGEVNDLTVLDVTRHAVQQAYLSAGWNATDVGVAEVHDCFSITEALMYEALGFCAEGDGVRFGADGNTTLTGSIPVNTGGGLMGFGHPVGATGVKQALEIYRQMLGLCGDYQLATPPERGVAANMGGDDRTSVVTLYQRVQ